MGRVLQTLTCHYVRYALIRCLVFTNEQPEAEQIAAYALAKSCQLSQRFGGLVDPGLIVELMLGMATREAGDKGQVISGKRGGALFEPTACGLRSTACFYPGLRPTARFFPSSDAPMLFVLNGAMCGVAGAINGLWRLARDLLILHHIEGLSPAELGAIHRMPAARVEAALDDARREFIELLGGFSEWVDEPPADVGTVLRQLAGCMDEACVRTVREGATQYLADLPW
jgi:hypothetical protein